MFQVVSWVLKRFSGTFQGSFSSINICFSDFKQTFNGFQARYKTSLERYETSLGISEGISAAFQGFQWLYWLSWAFQ